jgi:hypothetical protein
MELKEAFTANAIAEEEWEARAQLAGTKRTLKKQSVVIWVPEPDLRKSESQGRVLARDLAPSLFAHCFARSIARAGTPP